jgi:hypothetical protein
MALRGKWPRWWHLLLGLGGSGADGMEAVTGGECSFKVTVFEGETGEEEWTRRRVSAGKTEKVRRRID